MRHRASLLLLLPLPLLSPPLRSCRRYASTVSSLPLLRPPPPLLVRGTQPQSFLSCRRGAAAAAKKGELHSTPRQHDLNHPAPHAHPHVQVPGRPSHRRHLHRTRLLPHPYHDVHKRRSVLSPSLSSACRMSDHEQRNPSTTQISGCTQGLGNCCSCRAPARAC